MKKIFFISLIVLLTCQFSIAQKQANNWLFGQFGWITFDSGSPQALSGGKFNNLEGSASISDANGKLLFYTNGISVWNNRHFTMPNGSDLMGSPSSTQSAVIVPSPSDKNQYYVFTIDDCTDSLTNGFRYSIVDMTLSNGLGDVTTKNQLLHSMTTEKITAVMHQDNQSIWVVTHGYKNNEFYSYLVTKNGIAQNPVVSTVGSIHNGTLLSTDICGSLGSARGYMKTSPDGMRIAVAVTRSDFVELFDFDNATGRVSNPNRINIKEPYGLEFSPDGTLLYIGGWKDLPIKASLFQIDLSNKHITTLMTAPNFDFGAVQVGPDGKLYVAIGQNYYDASFASYLGCIESPNKKDTSCNFKLEAVPLAPNSYSMFGLPTFIQTFFYKPTVNASPVCFNDFTKFILNDSTSLLGAKWDFGDSASGASNTSNLLQPLHRFTKTGIFYVKSIFTYKSKHVDTIQTLVKIYQPKFNLPHDSVFCAQSLVSLDGGLDMASFQWSDGSSGEFLRTKKAGTYTLKITDFHGCSLTDSIKLIEAPALNLNLGKDTTFCDSLVLKVPPSQAKYIWNNAVGSNSFVVKNSGSYIVKVTDFYTCTQLDTIQLQKLSVPNFSLGKDTSICEGQMVKLHSPSGPNHLLWQDGSTSDTLIVKQAGTYWLRASNQCGSFTSTRKINVQMPPSKILQADTAICEGANFSLSCKPGFSVFQWSDGSTLPSLDINKQGKYTVKAKNGCGWFSDSVYITVYLRPFIPFGKDSSACEGKEIRLDGGRNMKTYQWNTGSTSEFLKVTSSGHYFLKITDQHNCSNAGSINIIFYPRPQIDAVDTSVYAQAVVSASDGTQPYSYWMEAKAPQANPSFSQLSPGVYFVKVVDAKQCETEPVKIKINELPIEIPNFFTPNGDGINDIWEISGLDHFPDALVSIFDRYGKVVYEFKSGEQGWNGIYGNRPANTDDYWYKLDLKFRDMVRNGHFTLKR